MAQEIKSAIVTGGGTGIGAATAKRLVQDGWAVTIVGRRQEKLNDVLTAIDVLDRTLAVAGDVTNSDDVKELLAQHINRFDTLDGLVNNAGTVVAGPIDQVSYEDWRHVFNVNVDGIYNTVHLAVPDLIKSGGSIVNVSSLSGLAGDWGGLSPYNATKGAVSNFTRALALELGGKGVRVNAVAPSLTLTDMASFLSENEEMMVKFRERAPLQRGAQPEEIASVIAFLLGPDASFVNGVNLPVDGGVSASNGQPNFG